MRGNIFHTGFQVHTTRRIIQIDDIGGQIMEIHRIRQRTRSIHKPENVQSPHAYSQMHGHRISEIFNIWNVLPVSSGNLITGC